MVLSIISQFGTKNKKQSVYQMRYVDSDKIEQILTITVDVSIDYNNWRGELNKTKTEFTITAPIDWLWDQTKIEEKARESLKRA